MDTCHTQEYTGTPYSINVYKWDSQGRYKTKQHDYLGMHISVTTAELIFLSISIFVTQTKIFFYKNHSLH